MVKTLDSGFLLMRTADLTFPPLPWLCWFGPYSSLNHLALLFPDVFSPVTLEIAGQIKPNHIDG